MGAIYEASYLSNSNNNWVYPGICKSTIWTKEENKQFESALAIYDEKTPDRWIKVAESIPGKSVLDVIRQYEVLIDDVNDIEAGLFPFPEYLSSPFTVEWVDDSKFDPFNKRSTSCLGRGRPLEHERKKGVPWTEQEHKRFLQGLQKHGKGDWRNISRNFVMSKTPTQVASHAQKYFLRQNSGGKDKRRPSIHDITTANLADHPPTLSDTNQNPKLLLQQPTPFSSVPKSMNIMPKVLLDWSNTNGEAFMVFSAAAHGRQNLYSGAYQKAYVGSS